MNNASYIIYTSHPTGYNKRIAYLIWGILYYLVLFILKKSPSQLALRHGQL